MEEENKIIKDGIQGGLVESDISENVKSGFLDYAMSVIVARALPDARDGFKPVHRRIIYSMFESGYTPDKPFVKCAKIVGDVMGQYHPHGDSAIYESLVRMAQDFSMRYPLVDGHGNFGNIDGDEAAAYRYTEARLKKISYNLVKEIKENTVDFIDNYDGSKQEPCVLPARIPGLLVNGSNGIAVGMATNIPPHNLKEVIDATIAYARNKDISVVELMNYIKGPDFPTKGYILGRSGIKKAYETGTGCIVCRGKANIIETGSGKSEIIISEIPYQVNKAALVYKIGQLADDKVITGISDVKDESSDKNGIRIVIELSKEAVPDVVLNQLYKQTPLQSNFNVQSIALVDGTPKLMTLKDMLDVYLEFQIEIISRRSKFRLDKALARVHIIDGLLLASEDIDNVIEVIKNSKTGEEAANRLKEKYSLSDEQVEAILSMTLRKLAGIERINLETERAGLEKNIEELQYILQSRDHILEVVIKELEEIREKYADDRLTEISSVEASIEDEDLIKNEDLIITLTNTGYIKRMPVENFKTQNRGGKGIKGMSTHDDDDVLMMVNSNTHQDVLFFTNFGKVYRIRGYKIPEGSRVSKGIPVSNFLNLDEKEKVASIVSVEDYNDKFLLFATKKGICKKTDLKEYRLIRQDGKIAVNLKDDDELLDVKVTDGSADICIASSNNRMVKFKEDDIRDMGRNATGVRGIKLDEGNDAISLATSLEGNEVLVITKFGYGKISPLDDYRLTNRGSKGVITLKESEKRGPLAALKIVKGDEDLLVITKNGILIRISLNQVSRTGRNTSGVRIINLNEGDYVSSVTLVPHQEEVEEYIDENSSNIEENNEENN